MIIMPCFFPMPARRVDGGRVEMLQRGHRRFGSNKSATLQLPCGRCHGCRLERSRQWAVRCLHEAQMHKENCYITLTYDEDNVPSDMSLHYDHFQRFMKRLRKHFTGKTVRFYMCGEYGETFQRPHFHAIVFGIDFSDRVFHSRTSSGFRLDTSQLLSKLWPYGFNTIGDVTFESAAYVARYVMKKITGDMADEHYKFVDPDTGEIYQRQSEFCHMSLKPGIGATWLEKYQDDVFPHGYVVARGRKMQPPKYYEDRIEKLSAFGKEVIDEIKASRKARGEFRRADSTDERLEVREKVPKAESFSIRSL